MNRRRNTSHDLDTSTWAAVDFRALSPPNQKAFSLRCQAIELYITGATVRDIEQRTGINSRQLYWLIDRCLAQAEDGRIFGFRGLLKHSRTATYKPTAVISVGSASDGQGLVGAFALLLDHYPSLADWLRRKIRERAVVLDQISTNDRLQTRLR